MCLRTLLQVFSLFSHVLYLTTAMTSLISTKWIALHASFKLYSKRSSLSTLKLVNMKSKDDPLSYSAPVRLGYIVPQSRTVILTMSSIMQTWFFSCISEINMIWCIFLGFLSMVNTVHILFFNLQRSYLKHQVQLFSFQAMVAGIQQAHAEQLANMRIQDLKVSLKPLHSVNNPILRKRKLLG